MRELEVLGEVARALLGLVALLGVFVILGLVVLGVVVFAAAVLGLVTVLGVLRLLGLVAVFGMFRLLGVLRLLRLVVLAVVLFAATVLVRVRLAMAAVAAVARLGVDLKPDLDALVLVLHGLGVDVPAAVVAGGASPEDLRAVVGEVAVLDVEAAVRFGANVALLLRGRGSQDATAVLAIPDTCEMGQ